MSQNIEFMKPRLIGKRFENHSIPLEVLKDLAALEEMVIEVAKWHYRKDNPGRKRLPKGFVDQVSLKVAAIDDGSAIPIIVLCIASSSMTLLPTLHQECFEQARESILSAIDAADKGLPVTGILIDGHLAYFDRVGRGLRDEESIEFNYQDSVHPARLTRASRRTLTLAASSIQELTEEVTLRGAISEADQARETFELELFDGQKIRSPIQSNHLDTILEAFSGYQNGLRVLIKGVGRFNRRMALQSLESVEHIEILDSMDVASRLDEFRLLKNGWLDGKGLAPKAQHLDWLTRQFETYFTDELPAPFLFPTAEGGVQAEWSITPYDISLDVELAEQRGYWHEFDSTTGGDSERDFDLKDIESWRWICDRLRNVKGAMNHDA